MTDYSVTTTLQDINDTLGRIEKNLTPKVKAPTSGELIHQVPAELDWRSDIAFKTEVSFIRQPNGKLILIAEIVGEDAALVEDMLESLPVKSLQISAVDL